MTENALKWCMLSPSAVEGPHSVKKTRKWCMLSPSAAARPRGDRKDQKVVHAVTMGCWRTLR